MLAEEFTHIFFLNLYSLLDSGLEMTLCGSGWLVQNASLTGSGNLLTDDSFIIGTQEQGCHDV